MLLRINHETLYSYDVPVDYGLQQLRLRPKSRPGQEIVEWNVEVEGGRLELSFEDEHANTVDLVSFTPGETRVAIRCYGVIDAEDRQGIVGPQKGFVPLWLFRRSTDLTRPGPGIRAMVDGLAPQDNGLATLHDLSAVILEHMPWNLARTDVQTQAEDSLSRGEGVCQDHAHVFVTAARLMGYPARYVSGYLLMDDRVDQDASHAWAEAHVDGLGWVGFDISNGISPDERYIRVATALDYRGAAPVSGMRFGIGEEKLQVSLQVQQ